jgi:hypothetical protein
MTYGIYTTRAALLARAARPADHMPMWLSWHFGWIPRVMIVLLLLAPVALLFDGFILETWRDERRNDTLRSISESARPDPALAKLAGRAKTAPLSPVEFKEYARLVHRQADKFEQATAALKAMPLREKDVAVHADIVKRYESYALAYRGLSDAYERNDPGAIQVAREKAGELLRAYADPVPVPMHVDDELSRIRSAKPKEDPKLARLTAKRKQGHLSLEEARELVRVLRQQADRFEQAALALKATVHDGDTLVPYEITMWQNRASQYRDWAQFEEQMKPSITDR